MGTRIETRAVASLKPASYNPRRISKKALEGLRASVERFGLVQPVIVNDRTGHIVGGHQRLKVLLDLGEKTTDVVVVDLPESEERALNVALNNPHTSGEFDDTLAALLGDIKADTPDLFVDLQLDALLVEQSEPEVRPMDLDLGGEEHTFSVCCPGEYAAEVEEALKPLLGIPGIKIERSVL